MQQNETSHESVGFVGMFIYIYDLPFKKSNIIDNTLT